jgi:polygalacturonase
MTREDVTGHGATGDGTGSDTDAVQAAIDAAGDAGGGTVRVPPGEYPVGTLDLRSGVTLDLAGGATLRGRADPDAYAGEVRSLLRARGATDVTLTGRGRVDGNAAAFVDFDAVFEPPAALRERAADEARQGERALYRPDSPDGPAAPDPERPDRLLYAEGCENLRVDGVTLANAPHWTVHFRECVDVVVSDVAVVNDPRVPNSDGLNFDRTREARVANCRVDTGDDAICLKTGTGGEGPTANVTVTNCTLRSRSAGVKVGSETRADVRDCTFSNLVVRASNRGLGIQHRDRGDVENLHFADCVVRTRLHSGNWWGQAEPVYVTSLPRTAETDLGTVRNVAFEGITAVGEGGVVIQGTPESPIRGLRLGDLSHRIVAGEHSAGVGGNRDLRPTEVHPPLAEATVPAVFCRGVEDARFRDLTVAWDGAADHHGAALRCEAVGDLRVAGLVGGAAPDAETEAAPVELRDGRRVRVTDCTATGGNGVVDAERVDALRIDGSDAGTAGSPGP